VSQPARKQKFPTAAIGDLVLLRWVDTRGSPRGWVPLDEAEIEPVVIESVGWVARVTPDYLCLAPHVGSGTVMGYVTVPVVCFLKLQVLRRVVSVSASSVLREAASA